MGRQGLPASLVATLVAGAALSALLLSACGQASDSQGPDGIRVSYEVFDSVTSEVAGYDGVFAMPSRVEFDAGGYLYVLDLIPAQVVKVDSSRHAVAVFGGRGQGPGELQVDKRTSSRDDLAVGPEKLVVFSSRQRSLNAFDLAGQFLWRQHLPPGSSGRSIDIAEDGSIVVSVVAEDHLIQVYSSDGELSQKFGTPYLPEVHMSWWLLLRGTHVLALSNNVVATLSPHFAHLRLYERGSLKQEAYLDLNAISGADSLAHQERVDSSLRNTHKTVDEVSAFIEAHPINTSEIRSPVGSQLWATTVFQGEPWIVWAERLFRIEADGSIGELYTPDGPFPSAPTGVAFHGNRVCIADGFQARLLLGSIPNR